MKTPVLNIDVKGAQSIDVPLHAFAMFAEADASFTDPSGTVHPSTYTMTFNNGTPPLLVTAEIRGKVLCNFEVIKIEGEPAG